MKMYTETPPTPIGGPEWRNFWAEAWEEVAAHAIRSRVAVEKAIEEAEQQVFTGKKKKEHDKLIAGMRISLGWTKFNYKNAIDMAKQYRGIQVLPSNPELMKYFISDSAELIDEVDTVSVPTKNEKPFIATAEVLAERFIAEMKNTKTR